MRLLLCSLFLLAPATLAAPKNADPHPLTGTFEFVAGTLFGKDVTLKIDAGGKVTGTQSYLGFECKNKCPIFGGDLVLIRERIGGTVDRDGRMLATLTRKGKSVGSFNGELSLDANGDLVVLLDSRTSSFTMSRQ